MIPISQSIASLTRHIPKVESNVIFQKHMLYDESDFVRYKS